MSDTLFFSFSKASSGDLRIIFNDWLEKLIKILENKKDTENNYFT